MRNTSKCFIGLSLFMVLPSAQANIVDSVSGIWQSGCVQVPQGDSKIEVNYSSEQMVMKYNVFRDATCRNQVATLTLKVQPSIGGLAPLDGEIYDLDMQMESAMLVPANGMAALAMNASQLCGMTGWKSGVGQSIAGKDCGAKGKTPPVGATVFSLISVGGSPEQMHWGKLTAELDGTSEEKRPEELDKAVEFHRPPSAEIR